MDMDDASQVLDAPDEGGSLIEVKIGWSTWYGDGSDHGAYGIWEASLKVGSLAASVPW